MTLWSKYLRRIEVNGLFFPLLTFWNTIWATVLLHSDLFCYLLIFYKSTKWPDRPNILLVQCDSTGDLFFLSQKKEKKGQNKTKLYLSVVRLYCVERREQLSSILIQKPMAPVLALPRTSQSFSWPLWASEDNGELPCLCFEMFLWFKWNDDEGTLVNYNLHIELC